MDMLRHLISCHIIIIIILNWMNVTWSNMKKLHWTDSEFDITYFLFLFYFYVLLYKLCFVSFIINEHDDDDDDDVRWLESMTLKYR